MFNFMSNIVPFTIIQRMGSVPRDSPSIEPLPLPINYCFLRNYNFESS